ncbi:signal transduction histidine kinase [Bacillus sp. SORGH_AS 510]|uniref:sensor histidine kinase n=1 Tax=Bacillus sp. SORGH_AS_0510 TaxID=3041771 RepID=UPI00277F1C6D|nr:HAMP domain-containing sensor histidine kinase [Bacillus sp. SORGH_AS_0510]MDQ1147776.1 signal transduction histidine kinase [Bacillus sp. SORGH_AS_0510]
MKKWNRTLSQKVFILILAIIGCTILFAFFFLHFLYKDLYLKSIRESVVYQGENTASHFHYGSLNEELIDKIHWFNVVSEYEVIVVNDYAELNEHFPYQIGENVLINRTDRKKLAQGDYVIKDGYVKEFDRSIVGAVFPILSDKGIIGLIFIYVPLAAMQEVFQGSIPILILAGTIYFLLLFIVVNRIRHSLFKPLTDMQKLSKEVAKGNYSMRLESKNLDEVGQLAEAFNVMSLSLEKQEERKKEFISNVVHELRTPLTYIGGYTQALKQRLYTSKEEAESYLTTIEKETERLNKIVHDLVDLNYLQENLYVIEKEPIAVAQLLFDTLELFQIRLAQQQLLVDVNIDEDIIICGDVKRMEQVFYNIIDNAVKYSVNQSYLRVELLQEEDMMVFRVSNQGNVIAKEDIPRIGERFFRTDKARSRSTGGSGLGLSIVKQIVSLHEGAFSLTSDPVIGTMVTVHIPALQDE